MKILFACPILDIRYEWFMGFTQIQKQLELHKTEIFMSYRKPVHIADTLMARKAIEGDFDYVLRMDDDVWDVPDNALEKMIKADKDFISCVMYASSFPYQRCAFVKKDKGDSLTDIAEHNTGGLKEAAGSGIAPVDMSAFPFTLIKTEVFKKVSEPWFETSERVPSDSYFCQKLLDNSIQPFVDLDLQVTHRGITYWNRIQLFLSQCEVLIMSGNMSKDSKYYSSYLEVRERLGKTYGENKPFLS